MRQDRFLWASSGEEIDPKRVTIVRDDDGEITGYLVAEIKTYTYEPGYIKRVPYCEPCDTDARACPGCGTPIEHGYAECIDCARL